MINNKKVVVIMPAYNAEKTLEKTYNEIYQNFVDEIILVDDFSSDSTKEVAKKLNIEHFTIDATKDFNKKVRIFSFISAFYIIYPLLYTGTLAHHARTTFSHAQQGPHTYTDNN